MKIERVMVEAPSAYGETDEFYGYLITNDDKKVIFSLNDDGTPCWKDYNSYFHVYPRGDKDFEVDKAFSNISGFDILYHVSTANTEVIDSVQFLRDYNEYLLQNSLEPCEASLMRFRNAKSHFSRAPKYLPYDNEHQPELLKEVITKYNGRTIITGFLPSSPSYKEPMIFTGI